MSGNSLPTLCMDQDILRWQLFPPKFCIANAENLIVVIPPRSREEAGTGESRLFWWPEFEDMSLLEAGKVLEKEACD